MSRVIRHADEVLSKDKREEIASLAAGNDSLQESINLAALKHAGGKYLTVREKRSGEPERWPAWLAHFVGEEEKVVTFVGIPYGGETKEEALKDADRIASKWGWGVIEP